METEREAGLELIARLREQVSRIPTEVLGREARLREVLVPGAPKAVSKTTIGREIVYVAMHTVHHHAMMGAMASTLGYQLPKHFGFAPSTLAAMRS